MTRRSTKPCSRPPKTLRQARAPHSRRSAVGGRAELSPQARDYLLTAPASLRARLETAVAALRSDPRVEASPGHRLAFSSTSDWRGYALDWSELDHDIIYAGHIDGTPFEVVLIFPV